MSTWSLFSKNLSDAEIEALRPQLFDNTPCALNFIGGCWQPAIDGRTAEIKAHFDRRISLTQIARSGPQDVNAAISAAHDYWSSLEWTNETLQRRKWVVKNFSRILHYFSEECLSEIRQQIPKTRLEAEKDFWEGKRAADHLEGSAERAMCGDWLPPMVEGHSYWKNNFLPAGVVALITPMNFIYGIPVIQMVGCYLSGSPFIFKGHPFAAITNTTLVKMFLAAGADPRCIQKVEGFGSEITSLTSDPRIAVVSVTGAEATAKKIASTRGVRKLYFEGGGCNWAWIDDNFTDEDLQRIAARLTYSKLALSSHKCTGLHGVAGSESTLRRLEPLFDTEFAKWRVEDPRLTDDPHIVGPLMVHKASTAEQIVAAAKRVVRRGGVIAGQAEYFQPAIIRITPEERVRVNWDEKGEREIPLATTEFFMPILCTCAMGFEEFLKFCLLTNPHDLATVIYSREDAKLQRARRVIGGMFKENDGSDSAMEWEAFGASGVGDSGNTGVGDSVETIRMFCRAQKGRHVVF